MINCFGKWPNHFSQIKEVLKVTENLWKKMKYYTTIKKLLKNLIISLKNAVSSLDINENSSIVN